ncbi:MAG: diguanylate cyclase [Deltaproteobacteria bacterium]|nr:diguanylate cyclase [Deltaproteobacteria bacterium]
MSEIELRLAADALREQTEIMHAVLDDMADAVIAVDTSGGLILHNRAALALFGPEAKTLPPSEWIGQLGLFHTDGVTPLQHDRLPLVRAMRGDASDGFEALIRSPAHPEGIPTSTSARPLRRADGSLRGGVSVIRDMTMQRRATEALTRHAQDMRGQATIDELTGLGNRRGFVTLAGRQLQAAASASRPVLLLLAELANLPALEAQGQDAVDAAVVELAWLLNDVFRDSDVVARLRENEFAALTPGLDDAEILLARVRRRLAERNDAAATDPDLPRAPLHLTLAVVAHGHGESIEALLVRADAELHAQRARQAATSAG